MYALMYVCMYVCIIFRSRKYNSSTSVLSLTMEGSLVNKRDLLALYLSKTYCHGPEYDSLAVLLLNNRLYISTRLRGSLVYS